MAKTIIDPEIMELLPRHSPEELAQLEANIVDAGRARDKIIVQAETNIVMDGHTRLGICKKHRLPYEVEETDVRGRPALIQWVIDNQMGRRNLTDERKAY